MNGILALAALSLIGQLPFSLEIEEVQHGANWPPLQSSCVGRSGGRFLLIAGRTTGMHTFAKGRNNFPPSGQNTTAYVIDPSVPRVLGSFDLKLLGPTLADPLSATNAQWAQSGDSLYIVGGYGHDSQTSKMTSFGTLTRIQMTPLIRAILAEKPDPAAVSACIAQARDPRLCVSGGSLHVFGPQFALVFGSNFQGTFSGDLSSYNRINGAQQTYTSGVWSFFADSQLRLSDFVLCQPFLADLPFNRRDFVAHETLAPDGTPVITVFGGVFQAGTLNAFRNPVVIARNPDYSRNGTYPTNPPPFTLTVDRNFSQALSQYKCTSVLLRDEATKINYATMFGGISQYRYDRTVDPPRLVRDPLDLEHGIDGLPFVDSIATIARHPDGTSREYIWPHRLPALLGTDAAFLPNDDPADESRGVIRLHSLRSRGVVGWIYGGIHATRPYSVQGPTVASNRLFRVWVGPSPQVNPSPQAVSTDAPR